jgi:hypothetical protein
MEKQLQRQSRWHCAMLRRPRYGTGLFLADVVTQRPGPHSWQAFIQNRLNAVVGG